jgi:putative pyruvate formate lyase activating enzyme
MYGFFRPDALQAFEDAGVKRALGRYTEVSRDLKAAKFLISRAIRKKEDAEEFLDARPEDLERVDSSLLDEKTATAKSMLESCHFCERRCGVNRAVGEHGFCGLGAEARLSSEFIHLGEEACLVPSHTFFFIGCTFSCIFCQNWMISRQIEKGMPVSARGLADAVKRRRILEKSRNVNLVGGEPTPNLPVILEMLSNLEVNIPVIWNSNMYMTTETMDLLNGAVDLYLADFKYGNDECALRLSKVRNYWRIVARNLLLARKHAELLIRHLVLPNHVECCTRKVLEWISSSLGNDVRVNIMAQYKPEFQAHKAADISRTVMSSEIKKALEIADEVGLTNLD